MKGIPWIRSSNLAPWEAEEQTKPNSPDVLQEQEQPKELERPHCLSIWKQTHQLQFWYYSAKDAREEKSNASLHLLHMYLHTKYDINFKKNQQNNKPCGASEAAARLHRAVEQGREGRAHLASVWFTS